MPHEELLTTLLKRQNPEDLTAYDIASKAYYRSSREQPLEAAVLFEAAARRAEQEFADGSASKLNEHGVRIQHALNHWARAGFNFYKAGEEAYALELLHRCAHADWLAAGLNHDLHTVGACWAYLVRHEAKQAFKATYARAKAHCDDLGVEFPFAHPTRKELGTLARELGMEDLAQEIVAPLRAAKPMKRDLRAWLKAFDGGAP